MQAYLDVLNVYSADHELNFTVPKCGVLPIGLKHQALQFLGNNKISFLGCSTDLDLEHTSMWDIHARSKFKKIRRLFNYLRHCVPRNVPSSAKFNLLRSFVVSLQLYGYSVGEVLRISMVMVLNGANGQVHYQYSTN